MVREIVGLALITVGLISLIAHVIATGRRAAADRVPAAGARKVRRSATRRARSSSTRALAHPSRVRGPR